MNKPIYPIYVRTKSHLDEVEVVQIKNHEPGFSSSYPYSSVHVKLSRGTIFVIDFLLSQTEYDKLIAEGTTSNETEFLNQIIEAEARLFKLLTI